MTAKTLKLLLVEDHPIVAAGCRQLFARHPRIVLTEATTIAAARSAVLNGSPTVAIVDVNLPDGSGLEFARELLARRAKIEVVIFSTSEDPTLAIHALDMGAKGFVSKHDKPDALLLAVEAAERKERWLSDDLLQQVAYRRVIPSPAEYALTNREITILRMLMKGRLNTEIAAELAISFKTVHSDCVVLRRKLNARTMPELIAIATRSNLDC